VESGASPVSALRAKCALLPDGGVGVAFALRGRIAALRVPVRDEGAGAWPLWRHTCFEAFVSAPGEPSYREFNFSPAGLWAAMAFRGYREMACELHDTRPAPVIETRQDETALHLTAQLPRALLPNSTLLRIGLSAIIERADGQREYWALHHPRADRADFHHPDGWTLRLNTLIERTQA
jgi:hypothetical protein